MKPLLPKEIRAGVSWLTEVYDFAPLSAGFEIEEGEVACCRSIGTGCVAVRTEFEGPMQEQCRPQARIEINGSSQTGPDSVPQNVTEEGGALYVLDFWAMMRSFFG